jgi:hypothetical protein
MGRPAFDVMGSCGTAMMSENLADGGKKPECRNGVTLARCCFVPGDAPSAQARSSPFHQALMPVIFSTIVAVSQSQPELQPNPLIQINPTS